MDYKPDIGRNFVNGVFKDSRNDFLSYNPSTMEAIGHYPNSQYDEVREAVAAARAAFPAWRAKSRIWRAERLKTLLGIFECNKFYLSRLVSQETGKSQNEARAEVVEALHMLEYGIGTAREPYGEMIASEIAEKDAFMLRKPKGVVAIISPWNFPAAIGAFWCAVPALIEGNTVVWKPSEETPKVAQNITEMYEAAGLPPGVFNMIHGDGDAGRHLVRSDVDHILFTGSAEVGQDIRRHCADTWHKTCSLELGSKSAVLVFPDADKELALDACVASAFKLSGQRCVSSGRILVHTAIFDQFVDAFVDRVKERVTVGDPFPEGDDLGRNAPFMGPLINKTQRDRVESYNDMVRSVLPSECIFLNGERPAGLKGWYLNPFVYQTEWNKKWAFLRQEVFGPHVALIPFDDVDDAIRIYNDTDYGLAMGVITNDMRIARRCREECDFGLGYWNGGSIAAESHLGFGGVKKSGNGFSSAARTYRSVTHEVAWTVNYGQGLSFPQGLK